MAFKLAGEPYLKVEGDSTKTMIQIQEEDTNEFGYLNVLVDGDQREKKEKELVALALERFFQKNYVDRAMPEAIATVEKMKQALEDVKAEITKSEAKRTEINQTLEQIRQVSDITQESLLEINSILYTKGILTDDDLQIPENEIEAN